MNAALTLLGPPQIELSGLAPPRIGAKSLALLAYLALEHGPHTREELATLLWSDSTPEAARASLRQALRQIRTTLGEIVEVTRQTVALAPGVGCDVCDFLAALHEDPAGAAAFDVPRFLSGFDVRHAAGFEEWCEATRATLLARYRDALRDATRSAMARSRWRDAIRLAERWVANDGLSDDATRYLVEALYMAGDRGEALARYEAHRRRLRTATGAEESASLQELARRIRASNHAPAPGPRPAAAEPPARNFEPALVGREQAWTALSEAWNRTRGGAGSVVLLEGEAGIGKTRLAEEFVQWTVAEGATVLRGRGYDPDAGMPYAPVVDAFREAVDAAGLPGTAPEWLAELARLVPELAVRFPDLPAPSTPGDTDRRWRLFESTAQVLQALASEQPTVLTIDDLQRCDVETCALLHFLTRRIPHSPILLLVTITLGEEDRGAAAARLGRAIRVGESGTRVVTLGPLSESEVRGVIRELGRITAPDGGRRFAARIHAATDGNPFHVLELLKALFAQGMLTVDPDTGEWLTTADMDDYRRLELPRTVHDAVAHRYTGLPYELRDLLATVATAGLGVSARLLSHVHGISRLRAAALADTLVEKRLLAGREGVYQCAHPVIVDVVRNDLTPARRQELHRAIAASLLSVREEGEPLGGPGDIARHAERGAEPALAHGAAIEAADEAVRRRAYEDALYWLDLAARTAMSDEEQAQVNTRTAAILDAAGWQEPPRRRPAGTPARGIARPDLDLRPEAPPPC